jgi:hypothetical protein
MSCSMRVSRRIRPGCRRPAGGQERLGAPLRLQWGSGTEQRSLEIRERRRLRLQVIQIEIWMTERGVAVAGQLRASAIISRARQRPRRATGSPGETLQRCSDDRQEVAREVHRVRRRF